MNMRNFILIAACLAIPLTACDEFAKLIDQAGGGKVTLSANNVGKVALELITNDFSLIGNARKYVYSYLVNGSFKAFATALAPEACLGGGTQDVIQTYDSYSVTYSNCKIDATTIDGGFSITGMTGTLLDNSTACPGNLSFSIMINNLTTTLTDGTSLSLDGDYDVTFQSTDEDVPADAICETASITTTGSLSASQGGFEIFAVSDFSTDYVINTETGDYTINKQDGTVKSIAASGTLTMEVLVPIQGNKNDKYPSNGKIEITDETAIMTMTINSNTPNDPDAVTIDLDSDGDGSSDSDYPKEFKLGGSMRPVDFI